MKGHKGLDSDIAKKKNLLSLIFLTLGLQCKVRVVDPGPEEVLVRILNWIFGLNPEFFPTSRIRILFCQRVRSASCISKGSDPGVVFPMGRIRILFSKESGPDPVFSEGSDPDHVFTQGRIRMLLSKEMDLDPIFFQRVDSESCFSKGSDPD